MKPHLKRIEMPLQQISAQNRLNGEQPARYSENEANFIQSSAQMPSTGSEMLAVPPALRSPLMSTTVNYEPDRKQHGKTPMLPKIESASLTHQKRAVTPATAINVLQEIQGIVGGWYNELEQVLAQIQDIYQEGPIVDGWLESDSPEQELDFADGYIRSNSFQTSQMRLGQGDSRSDPYGNRPLNLSSETRYQQDPKTSGYRLCGWDADGQMWFRPCPPEQVASVSMAISRYQKLEQLLAHKQELETRLTQLAETLMVFHSHLSA